MKVKNYPGKDLLINYWEMNYYCVLGGENLHIDGCYYINRLYKIGISTNDSLDKI
ncbi:MAG: hypothetical protein QME81_08285 [bacterium]|nr:hypothetical protein [bacterium]